MHHYKLKSVLVSMTETPHNTIEIILLCFSAAMFAALLIYEAILSYKNNAIFKKMPKKELYDTCTQNPNITLSCYFPSDLNTKELHEYIAENIIPFNGSNGFCIEQYFSRSIMRQLSKTAFIKFYEKGYCVL